MKQEIFIQDKKFYRRFFNKNNEEIIKNISNYALAIVAQIKTILSTKNEFKTKELLVLRLVKESEPDKYYLKILSGNNEENQQNFFKAIHKDIVGLWEDFNKNTFNLLKQMLYQSMAIISIYQNYGQQFEEMLYVWSNKIYIFTTKTLIDYP